MPAVDGVVLEPDRVSVGTVKLLLRSVRCDTISGQLVLGVRMVRDLDIDSGKG